jgi:carbamoyltransferase
MAGGVALNSVANGRIVRETPFRELFVQPAAGDGGGALGAALFAHHAVLGQPRRFRMEHAYWGKSYTDAQVGDYLRGAGISHTRASHEDELLDRVVDHLRKGHVIGWFQDRFEWGPRALGARSIIADPSRLDMKDIVNTKITASRSGRSSWVLVDAASRYFELDDAKHYPARFMLYVVDEAGAGEKLPAITRRQHARLQTAAKDRARSTTTSSITSVRRRVCR